MTFCDTLLQVLKLAFGRTEPDGWTDRRGSRNSYLDESKIEYFRIIEKQNLIVPINQLLGSTHSPFVGKCVCLCFFVSDVSYFFISTYNGRKVIHCAVYCGIMV